MTFSPGFQPGWWRFSVTWYHIHLPSDWSDSIEIILWKKRLGMSWESQVIPAGKFSIDDSPFDYFTLLGCDPQGPLRCNRHSSTLLLSCCFLESSREIWLNLAIKACCFYNLLVYSHKESLTLRAAAAAVADTCLGVHIVSAGHNVHKTQHSGDMGLISSKDVSITFLNKFWTAWYSAEKRTT